MSHESDAARIVPRAFAGGALASFVPVAALNVLVDNHGTVIGAIAGVVAIGSFLAGGKIAGSALAQYLRDTADGRTQATDGDESYSGGFTVRPIAIETTRDLPHDELRQSWSANVRYVATATDVPGFISAGHLDVGRDDLQSLRWDRRNVRDVPDPALLDLRQAKTDSRQVRDLPAPESIPEERRFRGISRRRVGIVAPLIAAVVGFAGGGVALDAVLPNLTISGAPELFNGSSDSYVSDLSAKLKMLEEHDPGAAQRIRSIRISRDQGISITYFDPQANIDRTFNTAGDVRADEGGKTSRGTFAVDADNPPPLDTMVEAIKPYRDVDRSEIRFPDEQSAEPIINFTTPQTNTDPIEGRMDGSVAPLFDTADLDAAYQALLAAAATYGITPDQQIITSYGVLGPEGGSTNTGPSGQALVYANVYGPDGGHQLEQRSGRFATYKDGSATPPEQPLTTLGTVGADQLAAILSIHGSTVGAEPADFKRFGIEVRTQNRAGVAVNFSDIKDNRGLYSYDGTFIESF